MYKLYICNCSYDRENKACNMSHGVRLLGHQDIFLRATQMTNLSNYHQGQYVTLENSPAILVIDGFERENNGNWHARVYFKCDPRKTTILFPVADLYPALTPEKEPPHASVH